MAARWWATVAFGYSRRGMKAPRTAHWLVVPALALGMVVAPVRAHAAPRTPAGEAEPAPPKPGEAGEAPTGKTGDASPKGKASKLPKASVPPKTSEPPSDAPAEETGEAETSPEADAGTTETEAAPVPDTPPADAPAEAPAAEAPVAEAPLAPEITVQPRPVEPGVETSPASTSLASREAVTDPRRLRSDDRILFRAGILSLGVAAAAVVPTAVGFQQAYAAHVDDDPARERTMRGLGIGAGIAAGTYAITGIVLMSLGARQRRAALAPAVGPGQLGAVLRARF